MSKYIEFGNFDALYKRNMLKWKKTNELVRKMLKCKNCKVWQEDSLQILKVCRKHSNKL